MGKLYTEADKNFIIQNYHQLGRIGCAEALGRTRNSIQTMAQQLGARCYVHETWTDDDLQILRVNFPLVGGKACAGILGRSLHATHKMANKLGLEMAWKRYYIDKQGYKVLEPDRGTKIYEHRYVMAQYLGRPLTRKEVVHHIDEDKLNNELSNLLLCTKAEHIAIHREALLKAQMAKLPPLNSISMKS